MSKLKDYVSQNGEAALFDTDKLKSYLLSSGADKNYVIQIIMVLECSNIKTYIERNSKTISSTETNNIILSCISNTGLRKEVVKNLMLNIFSALDITCTYEKVLMPDENSDELKFSDVSYLSSRHIVQELRTAETYMNNNEKDKAVSVYEKLAKAGSAEGMYYLGMCYFEDAGGLRALDSFMNKPGSQMQKGMKWIRAAAENGDPKAQAKMGDFYYSGAGDFSQSYSKAYDMYSGAGVLAADPSVKDKLVNILNQKKSNFIVLILGAVMLACMWLFMALNPISLHNACNLVGWGIAINVVNTLIYAAACIEFHLFEYDSIRAVIPVITVLWAVYPFILVLN